MNRETILQYLKYLHPESEEISISSYQQFPFLLSYDRTMDSNRNYMERSWVKKVDIDQWIIETRDKKINTLIDEEKYTG